MTDSYIQVGADGTGKKVQTVNNTVGANSVHAEAAYLVEADGTALTDTATITAIKTALELIDNMISGSEAQVDVVASLPAGTNAIGKLAANDGVDIGNVDVASVVPGSAASNLGKAEDAAHSSGDVGVMLLGVRNDGPTALSGTTGDYTPVAVDKYGRLVTTPVADFTDIKTAAINCATSGDNTIVAAQGAGTYIVVWSWFIVSDGTVDFRWESGAGGTALSGQVPLQAREGVAMGGGSRPLMVVAANTLLNLELSAAVNVHGSVTYTVES